MTDRKGAAAYVGHRDNSRDERIRDLWHRMTSEQHDRAWERLDDDQRVDAVRALFNATEETAKR